MKAIRDLSLMISDSERFKSLTRGTVKPSRFISRHSRLLFFFVANLTYIKTGMHFKDSGTPLICTFSEFMVTTLLLND